MAGDSSQGWICYHLYYHQDLNRAVLRFAVPATVSLLRSGRVDAFFFVRHGLGGPHLRLRFRLAAGGTAAVEKALEVMANRFLDGCPSFVSLPEETIRRRNEGILASDSSETDDGVYPDNTFRRSAYQPEVVRYGGPELLEHSIALFAVSTAAAVSCLPRSEAEPRSRHLARAFRLLFRQALHFAADAPELAHLARYAVAGPFESIARKADRVLKGQGDELAAVVRDEISIERYPAPASPGLAEPSALLASAARSLSAAIGSDDRILRSRIGGSQQHMTANRLGLTNFEEVYLCHLLSGILESTGDLQKVVGRRVSAARVREQLPSELLSLASAQILDLNIAGLPAS